MRYRARSRIRSYLYKTKKILQSSDIYKKKVVCKKAIDNFIKCLETQLSANKYHEYYFDRKALLDKLCDKDGRFSCGGLWNQENCNDLDHVINPYGSKAKRILFQTWNLDHGLELSRTVAPGIMKALEKSRDVVKVCQICRTETENSMNLLASEYYKLLFTKKNLKLVHIVCHDKRKHCADDCVYVLCDDCHGKELKKVSQGKVL